MKSEIWARVYYTMTGIAVVGCSIAISLVIAMVAR